MLRLYADQKTLLGFDFDGVLAPIGLIRRWLSALRPLAAAKKPGASTSSSKIRKVKSQNAKGKSRKGQKSEVSGIFDF